MSENLKQNFQYKPRQRLTIFVNSRTKDRLDTLCTMYNEKPGRLIDALIWTLYSSRAQKVNSCVTGKPCPYNTPFPDNLTLVF